MSTYNGNQSGYTTGYSSATVNAGNQYTGNSGDHYHSETTNNSGGGTAHNNMPPYLVAYIWKRIS